VPSQSLTIEQVLTPLSETPGRVAALTGGLVHARLRTPPTPDEWSANDVLAHLRACADVWGNYIKRSIAEDNPALRIISPRTWIRRTDYPALEFQPSFLSFARQRADLLAVLESLPPDQWFRAAAVKGTGKVLERTVLSFAQGLALHEHLHITQIERIIHTVPTG
jgi:hypothetical protein